MTKVIQIRGIPDDVHVKLIEADRSGKSLTAYLADELGSIARRRDLVWHNRDVIAKLRADMGPLDIPEEEALRVLREGREERTRQLLDRVTPTRDA